MSGSAPGDGSRSSAHDAQSDEFSALVRSHVRNVRYEPVGDARMHGAPTLSGGDHLRPLIYSMSVSLDGYIAGPGGEIDWGAPDAELHRFHNERVRELGLHILGRRLYEVMTYWETAEERNPSAPDYALEFAEIWKPLPKLVYSSSLETVVRNTRLSRGDPVQEVRALKEEPGEPIGVGGATLAASLTAHGLIDEYQLFVSPVVLGGGTPFFAGGTHVDLELIETRTFGSRVVYLRYRRI